MAPDGVRGGTAEISGPEGRHAASVLRLKRGAAVELFDGTGRIYEGIVAEAGKRSLTVSIKRLREHGPAFSASVTLAASVIKPERMDMLIEKSCELGVSAVIPVITERCVVRLTRERWDAKIKRWQKIALESCKQCGLAVFPSIGPVRRFEDLAGDIPRYDLALIPSLESGGPPLRRVLEEARRPGRVLAMIGPEGDFTEKEVRSATALGARPVSLGPLVLRSETAAIYVLSVLNSYLF